MDVEQIFWSQLDPLYHLKQASCVRYARDIDQHYRTEGDADIDLHAELVDGLEEMRGSALRFIRFHAAETMLTALLGSYPHGPVPRFSKMFFGEPFNKAVTSVARREIPASLPLPGVTDFEAWLATKFWCRRDRLLSAELVRFIGMQATLLSQKTVYNAFKHGCRIGRSFPEMSFQNKETGEWMPMMKIGTGVGWVHWEERKKEPGATVTFGAMECDPADDHGAIMIMAILVRAMRTLRLRKAGEDGPVPLPSDIKDGMSMPSSMNFSMKLVPRSGG
jgi:hypothetical protein